MSTREQVKLLRNKFPKIRAIDLARQLGVSKARIRAILVAEHLPTKVDSPKFNCTICNILMDKKVRFCSKKCRDNYFYRILNCQRCGEVIKLQNSLIKKKMARGERSFCSHSCRQLWFWANYPERMIRKRKNNVVI